MLLQDNFVTHLKKDRRRGSGTLAKWFAGRGGGKTNAGATAFVLHKPGTKNLSASVVCEGFWRRKSPWIDADITQYYHLTHRDWYGQPRQRIMLKLEDGSTRSLQGTFRSTRCLKLAVNYDNSPTGTMTCNHCARVPTLPSFTSAIERCDRVPALKLPNKCLSRVALVAKVVRVSNTVRNLRKQVRRQVKRKRTLAAKEALARDDVKKFCKELQYIAQRGTLEDKKVMWSYLQDVVRCEYLKTKSGPKGAHGMRWSDDTKDFAASQKLMAGKRLPNHLRENIGGPSRDTILRHLRKVRDPVAPGSPGVAHNMDGIRDMWAPIIAVRHKQRDIEARNVVNDVDVTAGDSTVGARHNQRDVVENENDTCDDFNDDEDDSSDEDEFLPDAHALGLMDDLMTDDEEDDEEDDIPPTVTGDESDTDDEDDDQPSAITMVELSEDESGIMPCIEYWRDKDSIYGSCGWTSSTHKCDDHFHPVIGSSWDRLVQIMSKAVVSTYIRVIMVNPLCDWLPPMTCHLNATCNKFDHHPHVTNQWSNTLKEFKRTLQPLGCNLTGRGSDGDGRRYKIQHELFIVAMEKLASYRTAATVLQRRWRRRNSFPWLVSHILRRRTLTRRPWVTPTVQIPPPSKTFVLPISLERAQGFTFAVIYNHMYIYIYIYK